MEDRLLPSLLKFEVGLEVGETEPLSHWGVTLEDASPDPSIADNQVRSLLFEASPERSTELELIVNLIDFRIGGDRPGFHLEASAIMGRGVVVYSPRTMQQVWLISFLAWQCVHEQSGLIIGFLLQRRPYDAAAHDVGHAGVEATRRIIRLSEALRQIRDLHNRDEGGWPNDVPLPRRSCAEFVEVEDRAVCEICCLASAFIFLHECHHALERVAGRDYAGREEELACDGYAARFLLDRVECFAVSRNYTLTQAGTAKIKRAIGVFLGLVLMLESTEKGLRGPTDSHPAWTDRVRAILAIIENTLNDNDGHFWVFATSIMLSHLRRQGIDIGVAPYGSARELFYYALDRFEFA